MTGLPLNMLVALGIGLLVGLERERSKGRGPTRGPAGLRTFALVALLGTLAMHLGGALLLGIVVAAVAGLAGLAYLGRRSTDPGLTTEVALVAVPLLGALALAQPLLAAGIAVIIVALLAGKTRLHRFVRGTLSQAELDDALVLAIIAIVVWPQLPDRAMGPYGAINPHLLGLVVILVLAISAAGHIMTRALGPRYGLPVSGLAAGFVSSVATTGAMGSKARAEPAALTAAVAGGTLSSLATFVQMVLVLGTVSRPTLLALAPALAAGTGVIMLFGGLYTLRAARSTAPPPASGRAFSLGAALLLAAGMAAILLLTAAAQPLFGTAGVTVGAALGGIVDTHAAAMSVAALVAGGKLTAAQAVTPVLAAMTVNAVMKIAMAASTATPAYLLRVGAAVSVSMAACWATAFATGALG
ncbi:MgtC/SapB family protein [Sandarakinorhabdus sp. DWP1-3-1]|uniref:MgtC/SapB family protein n=1 Tax=Sandarakinorhabdus sp. DWP1-3-1 TaxID=2804627 RepID=UPI003CEAAAF3